MQNMKFWFYAKYFSFLNEYFTKNIKWVSFQPKYAFVIAKFIIIAENMNFILKF